MGDMLWPGRQGARGAAGGAVGWGPRLVLKHERGQALALAALAALLAAALARDLVERLDVANHPPELAWVMGFRVETVHDEYATVWGAANHPPELA